MHVYVSGADDRTFYPVSVHERPESVTDDQVLNLVCSHWLEPVKQVQHLAVGYGGWHWRADTLDGPALFVTLDPPQWHDATSIEAAYGGADSLSRRLEFVHAPLSSTSGRFTVPLGDCWLSCTRWLVGTRPASFTAEAADLVRRLHAASPPAVIPAWEAMVQQDLVDELRDWTATAWDGGPHGEDARSAVRSALDVLTGDLSTYALLLDRLDPARYVTTHGEPGVHNQWRTQHGTLKVIDWESIRLAPPERDLLGDVGKHIRGDPKLVELFRLDWKLSEIRSYSDWLRGPHVDDRDTRVSLKALKSELG